jgi:hypothetical protein
MSRLHQNKRLHKHGIIYIYLAMGSKICFTYAN